MTTAGIPNIQVGYSSQTFEFRSKYPLLHMPARKAGDLVQLTNADHVVDGEHVAVRNREIVKITAVNLASIRVGETFVVCGHPGRADTATTGHVPVVEDDDYQADTKLVNQGDLSGYEPGVRLKVGIVAFPKAGTAGLVPASAGEEYIATCLSHPRSDGSGSSWVTVQYSKGTAPA